MRPWPHRATELQLQDSCVFWLNTTRATTAGLIWLKPLVAYSLHTAQLAIHTVHSCFTR